MFGAEISIYALHARNNEVPTEKNYQVILSRGIFMANI